MNKILTTVVLIIITLSIYSQDVFTPLSFFTAEDNDLISKAKEMVDRGGRMMSNADNEYNKYKDLFTSGKKGKVKKAEAKTVPVKKNMISAGNYFKNGYKDIYNLYVQKLNEINFEFEEDKQKADELIKNAEKKFDQANKIVERNQKYDEKKLKNEIGFTQIQKDIKKAEEDLKSSVTMLYEALFLYENQNIKKQQLEQKDDQAWQIALQNNSIEGYQQYLDEFPNGKYKTMAENMIKDLEQKIKDAELKQNNPNLIYHIQILADKRPWTTQEIRTKIFSTNENITEQFIDGWYKYWIGSFTKYEDAKKYLQNNIKPRRKDAFVVGTVNEQFVNIKDALKIQDKSPK